MNNIRYPSRVGNSSSWLRHGGLVVSVLCGLLILGVSTAYAAAGISFDQCANGTATPQGTTCVGGWINGNLQHNNSTYFEGDSVPQRATITGLSPNTTYSVTLGWSIIQGGKHSYDFLTSYNRTITGADACTGTGANCSSVTTIPIPDPGYLLACSTGQVSPQLYSGAYPPFSGQVFTFFGDVASASAGTYTITTCPTASGNVHNAITVTFTTGSTGGTVVLTYGTHVASAGNWGYGNSASQISGSPYHATIDACVNIGGCGSQDNQLQGAAVAPPPNLTTQVYYRTSSGIAPAPDPTSGAISQGTHFFDRATISGQSASGDFGGTVNGTLTFYVCQTSTVTPCVSGGTLVSSTTVSVTPPATGTYDSSDVIPTSDGIYCFRAEFISSGTNYSNFIATSTAGECIRVSTPTALYLSSFKANGRAIGAKLKWTTANEMLVLGFNVWRSTTRDGVYTQVNPTMINAKHVGDPTMGDKYVYKDKSAKAGKTYFYKLEVVGTNGTLEWSDIKRVRIPATP
jgi:hypothetical protein